MTSTRITALGCLALVACAADPSAPGDDDCSDDRCVSAGSKDELLASIAGFSDPVAAYLRQAVTDRGTLAGDYRAILDGAGGVLGCDGASERTYVVLSNADFIPKPIVVRCSTNSTDASQLFMAMVAKDGGFDGKTVHVAAWDADAGVYRRYATAPTASGELAVNVAPQFCLGCHGGPEKLGTWVPIMNELTDPWAGWNAQPGFRSQLFDEFLDAGYAANPVYREVTQASRLDSAAGFEQVIRGGMARVTGARLKARSDAPDVQHALELVRPLYCDETVNYVSEVHDSGELRTAALVDDNFRGLYRSLGAEGDWTWLRDTRTHLASPAPSETPVSLIPIRGEATAQAELALVSRGVLAPIDALRVRALDWKHPVGSNVRCDLYRQAADRISHGALDAAIAAAHPATTADLVPLVYREIMPASLAPPAGADVIATDGSTATAMTLAQLGAAIEQYVTGFAAAPMRAVLTHERDRRACLARDIPTAPIFPGVECP